VLAAGFRPIGGEVLFHRGPAVDHRRSS
jgi:hypothetical protein